MRKSAVLFSTLYSLFLNINAQPNNGFENWSTVNSIQEPDDWQTFNYLSLTTPQNPISVFKATGLDKHSGIYALKIKTVYLNNNLLSPLLPDTSGYIFTGKINISPPSLEYGYLYTGRPSKFEFYSKYIPVGNDKAGVRVALTKWNGISSDTIAFGEMEIPPDFSYNLYQVNLSYFSSALPDTAIIGFSSSFDVNLARQNSTLFIDDIAFTGSVGIEYDQIYAGGIKSFPNPATDKITILARFNESDNILIIDAWGRLAGNYKIKNYAAEINTCLFEAGIYFYSIRDKKNTILTGGKFNVIK